MWKALIKLQLRSYFGTFFQNSRQGKPRSPVAKVLFGILAIYLFAVFAVIFFGLGYLLAETFVTQGIAWFYFAIAAGIASLFGVIGSVFFAKTHLFEAKDNEALLAMPIPPMYILLARLLVLYVQTTLLEAFVLVPMYVAYFLVAAPSVGMIIGMVLMLFTMPMLAVTLCCLLARLLVYLSARIKNKGLVSLLLLCVGLGIYFPLYFGMMDYFEMLLLNAVRLADIVRNNVYPLFVLGSAFVGKAVPILVMTAIFLAIGAFCIWYMARSFLRIATTNRGFARSKKAVKATDLRSMPMALVLRELRRLWTCPIYLVNSAFGGIFSIIGCVAIIVLSGQVKDLPQLVPGISEYFSVILLGMAAFFTSISTTAPAISLEGKHIWILQTAPVPAGIVLWAKLAVHLLIVGAPVLLLILLSCIVLQISLTTSILLLAATCLLALFSGLAGLVANLLFPKMEWNSEAVPVKQGMSVLIAMLVNYTLMIGLALLYIFTSIEPIPFIILCNTVLLVFVLVAVYLLHGWGSRRFAYLR